MTFYCFFEIHHQKLVIVLCFFPSLGLPGLLFKLTTPFNHTALPSPDRCPVPHHWAHPLIYTPFSTALTSPPSAAVLLFIYPQVFFVNHMLHPPFPYAYPRTDRPQPCLVSHEPFAAPAQPPPLQGGDWSLLKHFYPFFHEQPDSFNSCWLAMLPSHCQVI